MTVPEYTVLAVAAAVGVTVLDLLVVRTRLLLTDRYWWSMAIVFAFQILVDGWLTKLSAPIVNYAPEHLLGVRWPWDIPVEDYLFGYAMVTLTLIVWRMLLRPRAEEHDAHTA